LNRTLHQEVRVKTIFLSAVLVFCLVCSASAGPAWVFLVDGELAFLVQGPDNLTDRYSSVGFGGGAGLGAILTKQLMFVFSGSYTYVPIDEAGYRKVDRLPEDATVEGGDLSIVYLSAGARYNLLKDPPKWTKPYIVAGAGWYRIEAKDVNVKSTTIGDRTGLGGYENAFGLNAGLGTDIFVSPTVNAFVEVQYQVGFTSGSNTATVPVRLGVAFLLGEDS
jgi:hypothetical protein